MNENGNAKILKKRQSPMEQQKKPANARTEAAEDIYGNMMMMILMAMARGHGTSPAAAGGQNTHTHTHKFANAHTEIIIIIIKCPHRLIILYIGITKDYIHT
jgi:hypothetical protein